MYSGERGQRHARVHGYPQGGRVYCRVLHVIWITPNSVRTRAGRRQGRPGVTLPAIATVGR